MDRQLSVKLLALAALAIALIVAVGQVESKVDERRATRDAVVQAIADQYAHGQQVAGPLLWVKCRETRMVVGQDAAGAPPRAVEEDCSRLIRPVRSVATGSLQVAERYRGIYRARVYTGSLRVGATVPAFVAAPGQVIDAAALVFGVSDPRGIRAVRVSTAAGQPLDARPGTPGQLVGPGFHVPLDPAAIDGPLAVNLQLELAGSGRFDWVPIASANELTLTSPWPHPAFDGRFLPEDRRVDTRGFTARWQISDFATGGDRLLAARDDSGFADAFGVSLVDPVDAYSQADRAVRYGFLFILLTLGGFFLFESIKRRPVHPLQYLLVGFAVVIFFLLLLALSEHIAFVRAYAVAAVACVGITTAYGRTLVGSWRGAAVLGGGYGALYAGLYLLLASEDYALLLGAWLIFGLLALTMWLTRRVEWSAVAGSRGVVA